MPSDRRGGRINTTMAEAGTIGGNRRVATQGLRSERRGGRINTTMDEMRDLARAARTIVDDRGLCETPGCQNRQVTATNPLCQTCVTEKNKRKREADEESGARMCAECGKEASKMINGYCVPCYDRQYRKTGRVVDPTKTCTHVSGCNNKRYMDRLCQRHYRNRHLEASSTSASAASASAATATKKRSSTKAKNGKKKAKTMKPVAVNKNGKTAGLTDADYADVEVDVQKDSDDDDDDDDDDEEYFPH
jgi:hypothetical protein